MKETRTPTVDIVVFLNGWPAHDSFVHAYRKLVFAFKVLKNMTPEREGEDDEH